MNQSMCNTPGASTIVMTKAGHRIVQADIGVEDWDMMFRAVTDRLTQCAAELLTTPCLLKAPQPASAVQAVVLECVEALGHLHTALKQQRSRRS